jgi:hypothetical protein
VLRTENILDDQRNSRRRNTGNRSRVSARHRRYTEASQAGDLRFSAETLLKGSLKTWYRVIRVVLVSPLSPALLCVVFMRSSFFEMCFIVQRLACRVILSKNAYYAIF